MLVEEITSTIAASFCGCKRTFALFLATYGVDRCAPFSRYYRLEETRGFAARERKRAAPEDIIFPHSAFL